MNLPDAALLTNLPELSEEEKHRATLEALADVDAGRTTDHEGMMTWAHSLFGGPNGESSVRTSDQ